MIHFATFLAITLLVLGAATALASFLIWYCREDETTEDPPCRKCGQPTEFPYELCLRCEAFDGDC